MTYCVGMLLDAGIVMLSDTRTNAGMDDVSTYRKMFIFEDPGERVLTIMTAGNLSVTQTVISRIEEAAEDPEATEKTSILLAPTLFQAIEIIGNVLSDVASDIAAKVRRMDQATNATASMIIGGQRRNGRMHLYRLYTEGNFIEATEDTPYLQIGEHKYGKPILDRVVTPKTSLEDARKAVLLSMDSTLRSNLSVGMPLDYVLMKKDDCKVTRQDRIEADDEAFKAMSDAWSQALRDSFAAVP
ncbi:MAG: peptidase [Hyphomicrobiales bacterium]|nr:MAG: peptidase [Hyphomicrobiales bacterium]